MELCGLMARRSPEPVVTIDADVDLYGQRLRARANIAASGELMRWWSAYQFSMFGRWETWRSEHLGYRPDRVGG